MSNDRNAEESQEQVDIRVYYEREIRKLQEVRNDLCEVVTEQEAEIKQLRIALKLCNGKLNKAGVRCTLAESTLAATAHVEGAQK